MSTYTGAKSALQYVSGWSGWTHIHEHQAAQRHCEMPSRVSVTVLLLVAAASSVYTVQAQKSGAGQADEYAVVSRGMP